VDSNIIPGSPVAAKCKKANQTSPWFGAIRNSFIRFPHQRIQEQLFWMGPKKGTMRCSQLFSVFVFLFVLLLLSSGDAGLHSCKNKKGGRYHPGQRDEGVWQEVQQRLHAGQHQARIAEELRLWPSTVWRIAQRSELGDFEAWPRGNGATSVQSRKRMKVLFLYALWAEDHNRELTSYVVECRRVFGTGSPSHVCLLLRYDLKLRIRRSIYEHPNKWTREGAFEYYAHFLQWSTMLTPEERLRLKFFDEVRVDRSCLG